MRVLHISKYFSPFKGGMENYVYDVMSSLARNGIECAAIAHHHNLSLKTSRDRFETTPGEFTVVRTGTPFKLFYTPISPMFPFALRKLLADFQPDVLHIHMPNPSAAYALAWARARNLPWVLHWHSDILTSAKRMRFAYILYKPLERLLLRRADQIITTSEAYLDTSAALSGFREKCRVIPLGLDARRLKPAETPPPAGDNPGEPEFFNVLAVGRLAYYKGFEFLIQAATRMKTARLFFVGKGEKENELKALVAKLGLNDRVNFLGHLSDQALARQFVQCDCLCLPSTERTEAFGIVLLEAMYFSKATLVSDIPGSGMSWLVEDGVTGIKVPPGDPERLANALHYMATNRDIVDKMGLAGKKKFEKQFDLSKSIDAFIDIYQRLR